MQAVSAASPTSADSPLSTALRAYRPLYALLLAVGLVAAAQAAWLHVPAGEIVPFLEIMLGFILAKFFLLFLLLGGTGALRIALRGGGTAEMKRAAGAYLRSPLFCFGLAGAVIGVWVPIIFIMQKCFVVYFLPFAWDPLFAAIDKALHFGHNPHDLLAALAEKIPGLAKVLDVSYLLWFPAVYLVSAWCLFCDRDFTRRMRYMWTYMLCFVLLGTVAAQALSSAGPVFFADFYPSIDNPYKDFLAHLARMDARWRLSVVHDRHYLLDWTRNSTVLDLNSIAAMPSMHAATIWLAALYLRQVGRRVFWPFLVLAVFVMTGAVYTGFHYAIDVYVAVAAVSLLWLASNAIVRRVYGAQNGAILASGRE